MRIQVLRFGPRRHTGNLVVSSPAAANGVVYVGSLDQKLYALDASNGHVLWTATTGERIYSSPAVADGMVFVGSHDHNLYAFALDAGNDAVYRGTRAPPPLCVAASGLQA